PVPFLSRSKDRRQVPLRPAARQATLSRGLPRTFVGSPQLALMTQPPLHLFAVAARFLFVRLLQAQVFPFQLVPSFPFLRLAPAFFLFSVTALPVSALPRLLRG